MNCLNGYFVIKISGDKNPLKIDVSKMNLDSPLLQEVIKSDIDVDKEIKGTNFLFVLLEENIKYKEDIEKEITSLIIKFNKYNNEGFFHETSVYNLNSIFEHEKIYSRKNIEEKGIKIADIADQEVLSKTSDLIKTYSRFYLRKNTPANTLFDGNTCILVCDYSCLYDAKLKIALTNKHTISKTHKKYIIPNDISQFINENNFDIIYKRCFNNDDEKKFRSAEMLCFNYMPLKYIRKIVFRFEEDKEQYENLIKQYNDNIELVVDDTFFIKCKRECM